MKSCLITVVFKHNTKHIRKILNACPTPGMRMKMDTSSPPDSWDSLVGTLCRDDTLVRWVCHFRSMLDKEGRRKKEEGRRKKEEGRRKKEEGRRKKEEGRRKKEEGRRKKEEGRRKKEEGRRKKEEGRRKKEEGRRKKEEGRRKKEEGRRKKEEESSSLTITLARTSFLMPKKSKAKA